MAGTDRRAGRRSVDQLPPPQVAGRGRPARWLLRRLARRWAPGVGLDARAPAVTGDLDPVAVTVHDDRAYAAVLRGGSVGLARSYAAGWWDCDDLTGLVRHLARATGGLRSRLDRLADHDRPLAALRRLRPPGAGRDRDNIHAHYDLSNEFFALMLDETMAYSCAVFERPDMTLAEAQRAKFDRLCRKLALGPDDHLVEIGTGWGGLAVHAARHYGCRVTTTTISERQRTWAAKAVVDAGVADRVTVLGAHYRELDGRFDKLVSVEMIEAVDWRQHADFFAACDRLLRPGGLMALQAIVIDDASYERAKHHADFIRALIFPGGCIPSVSAITAALARGPSLRVVDLEDIGRHYAETLLRWRANLAAAQLQVDALGFAEPFRRLWDLYLTYCAASFLERRISDVQLVLAKAPWTGPLDTRKV